MSQGKKYSDEKKEQVYMLYATCGNYRETARQIGVSPSTVQKWIEDKKKSDPDGFEQLRTQKKEDFIERASDIINKALQLLDKRITTAIEKENELEELLDDVSSTPDIQGNQKQMIINKIKSLELQRLGEITTAIGTLYDKRALAKGESTGNTKVTIELPKEFGDYGG